MEGTNINENRRIEEVVAADIDTRLVFGDNRHFAFIYKKTEKLATAVYMITNFIKDNEPLKWRIRENALSLLSLNIDFNTVSLSERKSLLKEYQALSLEIVSLSAIAHHSGLISEMNFHILSREFANLANHIEKDENKRANEETVILDPGFFNTPSTESSNQSDRDVLYPPSSFDRQNLGHVGTNKGHSQTNKASGGAEAMSFTSNKSEDVPHKEIKHTSPKTEDSKDMRQAAIIKILSKRGGLGIKDFEESIKGVSSKTIQRELLTMVAAGVLKKEGERRWSTYSLSK